MNCFYHPQIVAVGICKNCNKGICLDCAADVGNGLACKNKCEAEVVAVNQMINRSKTVYDKSASIHLGVSILFIGFGSLALIGGLLSKEGNPGGIVFGLFIVAMGILYFRYSRKIRKP